jgi:F-type H+-transporting ATPase subunit a
MSNFVLQMAAETPNATEYIAHHLTFLTNHPPKGLLDLSVVNYDSVFFSVLLALIFGGTFIFAARRATSGKQANILLRIACIPVNLIMELPTFFARPVSLALRLYGNMYAGEMVFVLIALLTLTSGYAALHSTIGWLTVVGSVLVGLAWTGFDLFIGLLQAFIFMMLTIVYLSQASEHH